MQSAVVRILIQMTGGLAVVVVSFWATTEITHYWSTPRDPNANVIHITEATYGKSCQSFVPAPRHVNLVKPGNATTAASQACDSTNVICPLVVDRIGNPAPGCKKDFMVRWRCGADQTVHQIYLPAEWTEQIAWVSCQAQ